MLTRFLMLLAALALPLTAQAQITGTRANVDDAPYYSENGGAEPAPIASPAGVLAAPNIDSTTSTASAGSDEGAFRTFCEASHLSYNDPILFPGVENGAHLHIFFGNPRANHLSNHTILRNDYGGGNTCGGNTINNSAYWIPALFDGTNQVRRPTFVTVYYKTDTRDQLKTSRLPRDLTMIFGVNPADPTPTPLPAGYSQTSNGFGGWKCENGGGGGPVAFLKDGAGNATINCTGLGKIGATFTSPQCWNGTQGQTATGRGHVRHKIRNNNSGQLECPVGFPYFIPHFDFIVWWHHDGVADTQNWYWSSDRMQGGYAFRNGESGHTDLMAAWDPEIFNTWQNQCIGLADTPASIRSCVGTQFGDGRRGSQTNIDFSAPTLAQKYMTIPPGPSINNPDLNIRKGRRVIRRPGRRHRH